MGQTVLGLDLGPTSIGWALLDEARGRILGLGVRVFPEGVDRDQGGEKSKSATRRTSRGMRRQIARRCSRKRRLRQLLTEVGLLPSDQSELAHVLAMNPYRLRGRALTERLLPYEIGRILIHLAQRRGFLSNRKTDRAEDKETKGMIGEIRDLEIAIRGSGSRTLGQYLDGLNNRFDHRKSGDRDRVRHRHTQRQMYRQEFEEIWKVQMQFYPGMLTDELKRKLDDPTPDHNWIHQGLLFGQRRMYWPRWIVGRCELELREKRCPRAHRAAQRFRLLQEVNQLRWVDTQTGEVCSIQEDADRRSKLVEYLSVSKERRFDQIRKKLGLPEHIEFNYERADRVKLKGHETDAALSASTILGKAWWKIADDQKDRIVATLIEEDQEEEALRKLVHECGLSKEQACRALAARLPEGYMSYSLTAIHKLLPHMERGLLLMAEDASNSALHAAGYLRPDERDQPRRQFLPPPPDVPNPIVRQALSELRKVLNAIIREYGCPHVIRIELAREAKLSAPDRRRIVLENSSRRREREYAAEKVVETGCEPNRRNTLKYLLWVEQGEQCPYSGRCISLSQLLSDEVCIDHILPRWRSLDDSRMNKVVCFRAENDTKRDRTPREWLEKAEPEKWDRVLQFIRRLPFAKQQRFLQAEVSLDDFVERQLRDTAYISRCVARYVSCLGASVATTRGGMTADLRYFWGLNGLLGSAGDGQKNRADHRHHAVDAAVIAMTNSQRLHALANSRGERVQPPWPSFREQLSHAVDKIMVSHRVRRRISGALHLDMFYGATLKRRPQVKQSERPWAKDWIESEGVYVRRKPVVTIRKAKHLAKIRDVSIRSILEAHLRRLGVDPDMKGDYPRHVFSGDNVPRMPSGVPIKRVRMVEKDQTFKPVSASRSSHIVKPCSNHHIAYYAVGDSDAERWEARVTSMWDAAIRSRTIGQAIDRCRDAPGRFIMSLSIGEAFEIDGVDGKRLLCVVRKMRQDDCRVFYDLHTDARPTSEKEEEGLALRPQQMCLRNARKVTVDPIGRIRNAGD